MKIAGEVAVLMHHTKLRAEFEDRGMSDTRTWKDPKRHLWPLCLLVPAGPFIACLLANILVATRLTYSMARDNMLPPTVDVTHSTELNAAILLLVFQFFCISFVSCPMYFGLPIQFGSSL